MQFRSWIQTYTSRSAHRLFIKIFLWFWLTIWGVVTFVFAFNHLTGLHMVQQPNMYATVVPILAAQAVRAYEAEGPEGFARFAHDNVDDEERTLYLLDGFNHDVLHRPINESGLRTVRAARSGQLMMLRDHIAAYRFTASSGHPYVLVLYITTPLGEVRQILEDRGIFFLLAQLSIITFLCLWLAYHIASPVHAIQSAARRVTNGDLSARAPQDVLDRHDELAPLARDFNSMVENIEALLHSHKNLLASVSHEIRSPLARLALSLELLRKEQRGAAEDLTHRMHHDIAILDNLMGQLLTLSRFEAGISGVSAETVDLAELVEEIGASGDFEARAEGKSVAVAIVQEALLQGGNHEALRSACENVVRNAVRFTPPDTRVEIELKVEHHASRRYAFITVVDRGPGVPGDMLESIFQPFIRVDAQSRGNTGNGLGLAIATEAVRSHRGSIVAVNRDGGGLIVTIRLPLDTAS